MDNELNALTVIFTEFYYWLCVVLMFLIHVGFCLYEVGSSRKKNMLHTLMKNAMLIPLVTVTFYFFGWCVWQVKSEHRTYSEEAADLSSGDSLERVMENNREIR